MPAVIPSGALLTANIMDQGCLRRTRLGYCMLLTSQCVLKAWPCLLRLWGHWWVQRAQPSHREESRAAGKRSLHLLPSTGKILEGSCSLRCFWSRRFWTQNKQILTQRTGPQRICWARGVCWKWGCHGHGAHPRAALPALALAVAQACASCQQDNLPKDMVAARWQAHSPPFQWGWLPAVS